MKRTLYSGVGLLLVGLLFLAFNLLSSLLLRDQQFDLTQQKLYTFSAGTQEVLDSLDEPLNLYLFFSKSRASDLPALRNYARRVEEVLDLYARRSHGNVRLFVIDPLPFSDDEDRAARFGLQAPPIGPNGEAIYFGLAATNPTDGLQVIPFFSPEEEPLLEYDLSRLVQALAQRERTVVGLMSSLPMTGQAPTDGQPGSRPWAMMDKLYQQFDIRTLGLASTEIPAEVSVLMLVHPRQLSEQTQYAIDQFVLRGGKLLAFVDPWSEADHAMPMPSEMGGEGKSSDLPALFKAWGFEMLPGKVLGDGAYAMSVSMGQGERPARHPAWLTLPRQALDPSDVATANLETLTVATAGILRPLEGAKTHFVPLIHSSEYAMPFDAQRFAMLRNPQELMGELNPSGDRYTVAARISGPAQSAFPDGIEGRKDGLKSADNINVIVVADTDMLSDRMWVQVQDFFGQRVPQPWADNSAFAINALDNLSGSEALISVRSRGRFTRPFTVVEDLQRQAEARFREQEQALKQRLSETEEKLASLQNQDPAKALELTPEQQATLQQFMQEKLRIRKELREVNYQLNADIEKLGRTLKFINIALVPLVLTLGVLLLWAWRRRRA